MPLCESGKPCPYSPWESSNPISEEEFLEKLEGVGVTPSGEGPKRTGIGSPFRVPAPLAIELCCLDAQICADQAVEFPKLNTRNESDAAINAARAAVYQEAGLPGIDGS